MPNIREIRDRIESIKQILKITNAMYLISSSKLKKARNALESTEPYFYKLQETTESVLEHTPHMQQLYFDRRSDIPQEKRKKGYIVITGDKGLCGSYNHNILKFTEQKLDETNDLDNCYLFVMGQVGRMYFQRRIKSGKQAYVDGEFLYTTQNPTLYRAGEIADTVLDKFRNGKLDEVWLLYTDMVTSSQQETKSLRLLPFERRHFGKDKDGTVKKLPKASFVPSPERLWII